MREDIKHMLASYGRAYVVAMATMSAAGENDIKKMAIVSLGTAIVGPALRAANPKDPAFGMVADVVEKEIKKVAEADKKKSKKK